MKKKQHSNKLCSGDDIPSFTHKVVDIEIDRVKPSPRNARTHAELLSSERS